MRAAGRVVAEMHDRIRAAIRPGVTTADLDRIGRDVLERRGATSNFLGYHGYPAVICASVERDRGARHPVGDDPAGRGRPGVDRLRRHRRRLARRRRLHRRGGHGQRRGRAAGGGGRGRPRRRHRRRWCPATGSATWARRWRRRCWPPGSTCCGTTAATGSAGPCTSGPTCPTSAGPGRGPKLAPGVVLAVEPMVVAGSTEVEVLDDGWSVRTGDGRLGGPHRAHDRRHRPRPGILTRAVAAPLAPTRLSTRLGAPRPLGRPVGLAGEHLWSRALCSRAGRR